MTPELPPDLPAIDGGTPVRSQPLPFFTATIDESDIEAVVAALRSGWLTMGPRTEAFEAALADYLGTDHAVAISSCSEAMFLSLKALGVGPGDEVVTSSNTFASTVSSIIHCGATPVLADIEHETFGPDPASIESVMTERTRAIMPVHFGGQACRIAEIMALARKRGLTVVEDAAHSFGASANGKTIGGIGAATAFSFYATKNFTSAEGGAVTTNSAETADAIRRLTYHGMSRDSWARYSDKGSWYYEVTIPGHKSNLNDVLASLGLSQLSRIDALLDARREVAAGLSAALADVPGIVLPVEAEGNRHTWHLYVIRIDTDTLTIDRDRFSRALTEEGIGNSVHFIPVYRHPFFSEYGADASAFPSCEAYFASCLSLPIFPGMSRADVADIATAIERIVRHYAV
jgi:dTDP-4-amino-4,6-dideoxygalactose transaminase